MMQAAERRAYPRADAIDVVTPGDVASVHAVAPTAHVRMLPLGASTQVLAADELAVERPIDLLLFATAGDWPLLLDELVPALRDLAPDTSVAAVGVAGIDPEVARSLERLGVERLGFVDDLGATLRRTQGGRGALPAARRHPHEGPRQPWRTAQPWSAASACRPPRVPRPRARPGGRLGGLDGPRRPRAPVRRGPPRPAGPPGACPGHPAPRLEHHRPSLRRRAAGRERDLPWLTFLRRVRSHAADARGASRLPSAWVVAAGVLAGALVTASLSRPWWSDASWPGAVGAAGTAAACVWLLLETLRLRAVTLGAFTAVVLLAAFWAKWMAASEPLKIYFIEVPFDNDLAIQVTGTLAVGLALGWVGVQRLSLRRERTRVRTDVTDRHAPWHPPPALLVITALALCALKVAVADVYSVGVPGETPRGLDVPALKTVIYYSSTYGPLACASLLALSRRSQPWLRWGAVGLVLLGYVAAGGYVGSRAATVNAALVLGFVALAGPRSGGARFSLRHALGWLAVAAAIIVSLTLTLIRRPIGSSSAGPLGLLGFLEDRIGGLDFLSVAAAGVDQHGWSLAYVHTTAWVEFLTFQVYEYPEGSITGVAASLPGTAFGIGGWVAVVLVALACGGLVAIADAKYARILEPAATTWYLGLLLAWGNLLLEGTLYPTLLIILSFGSVYVLLLLVGRWLGHRSRRDAAAGHGSEALQAAAAARR